jgi:hypothetical protein
MSVHDENLPMQVVELRSLREVDGSDFARL